MKKEILINHIPKTDFEKLLFAESYVTLLKVQLQNTRIEKGKIQSGLDEVRYELEKTKNLIKSLKAQNKSIIEKVEIKTHLKTIKLLRSDNRELIAKLVAKNQPL